MKKTKCPGCGQFTLDTIEVRNSLSRYCSAYICSDCGMKEAFSGFFWRLNAVHFGFLGAGINKETINS